MLIDISTFKEGRCRVVLEKSEAILWFVLITVMGSAALSKNTGESLS